MARDRRKKVHLDGDQDGEVDFSSLRDVLARPVRRPIEPGMWRSLIVAAMVGAGMGLFLWYFKPGPSAAEAAPISAPRMMNVATTPAGPDGQSDLFQLPAWDEAAYQHDRAGK